MKPISKHPCDIEPSNKPAWQHELVLIAKNIPVWLAQLSETYKREIISIDQVPGEELDQLHDFGITGLWLVGIWMRSPASQKIKHLYGNKELIASAYSVYEYRIADEIGGESALASLKNKAKKRGIRLACDMVPNHTAIDSPWLIKHPEWYIQVGHKPNDTWNFDSQDMSPDPDISIQLEKGYYSQTGAAEVFQFRPVGSDKPTFIYHGNDGTSMPWNDTAQLNYLNPETREAMKAVIIDTAKKFDIIRLDAAMTLIKQHFKRLWFPENGDENSIPTRSTSVMTETEFDRLMPDEFWCEVLQALSDSSPDTLILAEAFWMMEKYFVRSMGMHRVYNSAFLNQLRDEKNENFRNYMREIIQSDRFLLDSFINYLTTPDEHSAAAVFGKGKKYFGVCGLMAALPGLPLFGHGQIEGFAEHYRMDYARPYIKETTDKRFMKTHKQLITPLLNQRGRFASAENLTMLDFMINEISADENVLVFSNQVNSLSSLIILNNQDKKVSGAIKAQNMGVNDKTVQTQQLFNQKSSLNLRELRTGITTIFPGGQFETKGLAFCLEPYDFFVYDVS